MSRASNCDVTGPQHAHSLLGLLVLVAVVLLLLLLLLVVVVMVQCPTPCPSPAYVAECSAMHAMKRSSASAMEGTSVACVAALYALRKRITCITFARTIRASVDSVDASDCSADPLFE
jgi:hypothetical protein